MKYTVNDRVEHIHTGSLDTARGEITSGDNFGGENLVRGKLQHTSNFGAGPLDTGTLQGHSTHSIKCSLWPISSVKLWQAQILKNTNSSEIQEKKKSKAP